MDHSKRARSLPRRKDRLSSSGCPLHFVIVELKDPLRRVLIRNLRMLSRHLWEFHGDIVLIREQFAAGRTAWAKGHGR